MFGKHLENCSAIYLFLFPQTFLEQSKTRFNKQYKGMSLSKITTTVGLNSKMHFKAVDLGVLLRMLLCPQLSPPVARALCVMPRPRWVGSEWFALSLGELGLGVSRTNVTSLPILSSPQLAL